MTRRTGWTRAMLGYGGTSGKPAEWIETMRSIHNLALIADRLEDRLPEIRATYIQEMAVDLIAAIDAKITEFKTLMEEK